ncbi:MAG: SRPBCC family protein [Woeseiaceae bacterium]
MKRSILVAAAAAGALATYLFDSQQGRRRRARLRDKIYGALSHADEAGGTIATDLSNRTKGLYFGLQQRFASADVPDAVIAERIRSKLGRFLSHPGSIDVAVNDRAATLQGPILMHEVDRVLKAVRKVPGVRNVIDHLEPHQQRENISGLQGGRPRMQRIDVMLEHWAPATRVLAGGGGAILAALGVARRSALSLLLGAAGAALFVRAATNMDTRRLLGQRGRLGIDFTKTMNLPAPVEEVFAFWSNFENFPKFMRNVRRISKNAGQDSWHWEVAGPLGVTMQWDARVTQMIPNELIAWSTAPGSQVQHAGIVRFQPEGAGTRLQIEMTYNPPGAAAGHAVASLFGADPGAEMDDDLMRLKAFFETGKPARDSARVLA